MREAAATAKASALGDVFGTIFRNITVRENATKQLPYSNTQPGGVSYTGFQPSVETSERTSE